MKMKSKLAILAFLFVAIPGLAQSPLCISSGGQIGCVIPGATITGSGATQVVALPGNITATTANLNSAQNTDALTIGQNGNSGEAIRIYQSYVSASNNESLQIYGNGSRYFIEAAKGSSGSYRELWIGNAGADSWIFNLPSGSTGELRPNSDNSQPIGTLTARLSAVNSTSLHSGATNMTFSTGAGDVTALTLSQSDQSATFAGSLVYSNCSTSSCGSNISGGMTIPASSTTRTISTTAVTANSQIFIVEDASLGTRLGVTCNTQALTVLGAPRVTSRTAGASFVVSIDLGPTTNPMCFDWWVVN